MAINQMLAEVVNPISAQRNLNFLFVAVNQMLAGVNPFCHSGMGYRKVCHNLKEI